MTRKIVFLLTAALAVGMFFGTTASADQGFPNLVNGHPVSPRPGNTNQYADEAYWITQAAPMLLEASHGSQIAQRFIYKDGYPMFLYLTNNLHWDDPWSQRVKLYPQGEAVVLEDRDVPLDTCVKALKNNMDTMAPGAERRLTSTTDEMVFGVYATLDVLVGQGRAQRIATVETVADIRKVCYAPHVVLRQTIRHTTNPLWIRTSSTAGK